MALSAKRREKLPPGAVIVADASLRDSSAKELIIWQKAEGYGFPVVAITLTQKGLFCKLIYND